MNALAIQSGNPPKNPVDPVILSDSDPTTGDANNRTHIAWQGLAFSVPPQWNPIDLSGNRTRGAIRVGDLHRTTMQFDWRIAGRRQRAQRTWKRYLKRQLGLKPTSDRLTEQPALAARLGAGGWVDVTVARIEDRGGSIHALARSALSRRFVLIRIVLGTGDDETGVVDRVLGSLRESRPQEPESWSVYGFGFRVPARSRLSHWRLRPGHLELTFRCRGLQINWQRIAMAERTMGERTVPAWLEQHLEAQNRRAVWTQDSAAPRDGWALHHRSRLIRRLVPESLRTAGKTVAWHTADTDQLVVLTLHGWPRRIETVLGMLCESWCVRNTR